MAVDLARHRVEWTGFMGAPGVSTFYSAPNATGIKGALQTFFTHLRPYIPSQVTMTIQAQGDLIDDATGALTGAWADGADIVVTGGNTGAYSAAVGAFIGWKTAGIHNAHHLQGRTFIVPLLPSVYGPDGQLTAGFATDCLAAATTLISDCAGSLQVWGRPGPKGPGSSSPITSAKVPRKGAVLRSRRD